MASSSEDNQESHPKILPFNVDCDDKISAASPGADSGCFTDDTSPSPSPNSEEISLVDSDEILEKKNDALPQVIKHESIQRLSTQGEEVLERPFAFPSRSINSEVRPIKEEKGLKPSSPVIKLESDRSYVKPKLSSLENLLRLNASLRKTATMKKVCNNTKCISKSDDLVNAPSHAMTFFGVQFPVPKPGARHPRNEVEWKICKQCMMKADEWQQIAKNAVKNGENLFELLKTEVQPYLPPATTIVDLEDNTEIPAGLDSKDTKNKPDNDEPIFEFSTKDFNKDIEKILDKVNIKRQLHQCKTSLETDTDQLAKEFNGLENQMDDLSGWIQSIASNFNSTLAPCEGNINIGEVIIQPDGTFAVSENKDLDDQCQAYGVNKNSNEVMRLRRQFHDDSMKSTSEDCKVISESTAIQVAKKSSSSRKKLVIPPAQSKRFQFQSPKVGQHVYALQTDLLQSWGIGKILKIEEDKQNMEVFYSVKMLASHLDVKRLRGTEIAFKQPFKMGMPVGSRVIAKFKDVIGYDPATHNQYFAGIVAETNHSNKNRNRCLIFFDDGYCQYVIPNNVLPIVKCSEEVWKDVHKNMKLTVKTFIKELKSCNLLRSKPKVGEELIVDNGLLAVVDEIDCSLIKICYAMNGRFEWIYNESPRLTIRLDDTDRDKKLLELMKFETAGTMTKISIPADRPVAKQYVLHDCSPLCAVKYNPESFRNYSRSPLVTPFYLGWARDMRHPIAYISPCGLRLWKYEMIDSYNSITATGIPIDFYSLEPTIDCLNMFKADRQLAFIKDISYGEEWTPVQCINSIDHDLPTFSKYTKLSVVREGVNINNDKGFFVCCDCVDNCLNKAKCPCWKLTLSGPKLSRDPKANGGYVNRRLPEFIDSGIYECNKHCKCNVDLCTNRVVQNNVQWPVQLFKTVKKGWGVRSLFDMPQGSFICVYSGQILSNAVAEEMGKLYGDQYIADLDYIEVMESRKEGYEPVCLEPDGDSSSSDGETLLVKGREKLKLSGKQDADLGTSMSLQTAKKSTASGNSVTSRKCTGNNQANFDPNCLKKGQALPYRKYFSGEDCRPYAIDGKHYGNFGRYFNHSCEPNIFIQSVFVDTHDIRFPWVAFFTNQDVKAGTELCWDYRYQVGSVPGKRLLCYCESKTCRRVLL